MTTYTRTVALQKGVLDPETKRINLELASLPIIRVNRMIGASSIKIWGFCGVISVFR